MPALSRRLDNSPGGQIVKLLQRKGAMGVKDLRRELGVSDTAVRQQIAYLMAEGYLASTRSERSGPGRPHYVYTLTDKARDLFACYCEDLALNLYEELLADQGPAVVRRLLNRVGERLANQYQEKVRGEMLQERVRSLAAALDERGILADVSHNDDIIYLHEYNCPYHELAAEHREICEMEEAMMSDVLGAEVELQSCIMDGDTGCSFAVRPR